MNSNDITQNMLNQFQTAITQAQQELQQTTSPTTVTPTSIPATRKNVINATKPQLNTKQVANLIQPSRPLAMYENTLVQLSEDNTANRKNK